MAKLSAFGRTELLRLTKQVTPSDEPRIASIRWTVALMSDGRVLKKADVRWVEGEADVLAYRPVSHIGWKQLGPKMTQADFLAYYKPLGYEEVA